MKQHMCEHGELVVDGEKGYCLECDLKDPKYAADYWKYMKECDDDERAVQSYGEDYDTK